MSPEEYIFGELSAGRLTAKHIQALTLYYQGAHVTLGARDGMPGPKTRGELEKRYPAIWPAPGPVPLETLGKWLRLPLPMLPGKSNPQARKPQVTSSFRPKDRPDHDGLDLFYRWEPGDEPKFVGDGGCEGKNADGSPKWVVPYGTHALAAADGVVQIAGPSPTGFRVWIDHGNGWRTGYFHLASLTCAAGAKVQAGYWMGSVGHNPSPAVDGRHLHFELSPVEKYAPVDPEPYLQK